MVVSSHSDVFHGGLWSSFSKEFFHWLHLPVWSTYPGIMDSRDLFVWEEGYWGRELFTSPSVSSYSCSSIFHTNTYCKQMQVCCFILMFVLKLPPLAACDPEKRMCCVVVLKVICYICAFWPDTSESCQPHFCQADQCIATSSSQSCRICH